MHDTTLLTTKYLSGSQENLLPLASFPILPRPNTPFELWTKKDLGREVAYCRPKSDHPLTLLTGPLLGFGAQDLC